VRSTESLLLYYITDRQHFAGSQAEKQAKLLARIAEAATSGIDFIQLRERDLPARELEWLAEKALLAIGQAGSTPIASKLLINSRLDVALAMGAHGVHLRADDICASEARAVAAKAVADSAKFTWPKFCVSVSCHTQAEVRAAEAHGADLVLFAPVFEKTGGQQEPHGIKGLRAVCRDRRAARPPVQVLALGGVDLGNAASCLKAGAAGVAGIRLFQEGELAATVKQLRGRERKG
jgi:thiamine-phosphate pyrophosphorylase